MTDLADGETFAMQGSGAKPYVLKNSGGVYSCSCPAWRNQSASPERRSCKHLKKLRGEAAESERVGGAAAAPLTTRAGKAPVSADSSAGAASEASEASAPPLLLAHVWDSEVDLAGWWMSEKLDGVRAYWDGQQFVSRLGNRYHAPPWFTAGLPRFPLDGELWLDRKAFQRTVSIVRRQDQSDAWREIKFLVFDAPGHGGSFEARVQHYHSFIARERPSFAQAHPHEPCRGVDHLRGELKRVEALGGEGLMLRRPGSAYEVGRSHSLLKVKSFFDAEARVIGHQDGAGRHRGRLGALLVELQDGTRFAVGSGLSDAERGAPPPLGSIITFRYQELSDGGVPRFPTYVGVRHDVAWKSGSAPGKSEVRPAAAKPGSRRK
jgi:DNA ligase-1